MIRPHSSCRQARPLLLVQTRNNKQQQIAAHFVFFSSFFPLVFPKQSKSQALLTVGALLSYCLVLVPHDQDMAPGAEPPAQAFESAYPGRIRIPVDGTNPIGSGPGSLLGCGRHLHRACLSSHVPVLAVVCVLHSCKLQTGT